MADKKHKQDKPSQTLSTAIAAAPLEGQIFVPVTAEIRMEDVINVAMSRAEERMQAEIQRCGEQAQAARELAHELSEQAEPLLQAQAEAHFAPARHGIAEAFASLGAAKGVKFHISQREQPPRKSGAGRRLLATLTADFHNVKKQRPDDYAKGQVTIHESLRMSAAADDLLTRACQARRQAEQLAEEQLEWKKKSTRMPQLERKYRGRLAEQQLRKTAAGEEMVAALLESIDADVKLLPGC